MHARRPTLALSILLLACARARAPQPPALRPPPVAATAPAVRGDDALSGESSSREVIERIEDVSPYAPDAPGLEALVRAVAAAVREGDRARIESVVGPVVPRAAPLRLAMTFEGGRALIPRLTGLEADARTELLARAGGWADARAVTARGVTGAELQRGENAAAYDPAMRRIASLLRPGVRFYRVELAWADGRRAAVETWVYAGGRWMFAPSPWRYAPEAPPPPAAGVAAGGAP
jgi:hypothetical protein